MKINPDELQRMIASGFTPAEISKYLTSQGVKCSRQKLNQAIEIAGAEIRKLAQVDFEYSRGEALIRLGELYKKSILISDYKTALAVTREKAHLLGLQINPESGEGEIDENNLVNILELNRAIEENFGYLNENLSPKELVELAGKSLKGTNEKVD